MSAYRWSECPFECGCGIEGSGDVCPGMYSASHLFPWTLSGMVSHCICVLLNVQPHISRPWPQGEGYLVVMTHCEEDGEEEAEDMLQKHLLHLCHLHLHAQGLKTGYSKDIHGEVCTESHQQSMLRVFLFPR